MSEQMLANKEMDILLQLYTGIFQLIPGISVLFEEKKLSEYYADLVEREINFSDNACLIKPDDYSASFLRVKLQEDSIPFVEIQGTPELKPLGFSVFVARESDFDKIQKSISELEEEQEQVNAVFLEKEEDDLERTRDEENPQNVEEETPEASEGAEVEEEEEEASDNNKDKDKKKKDKDKQTQKGSAAVPIASTEPSYEENYHRDEEHEHFEQNAQEAENYRSYESYEQREETAYKPSEDSQHVPETYEAERRSSGSEYSESYRYSPEPEAEHTYSESEYEKYHNAESADTDKKVNLDKGLDYSTNAEERFDNQYHADEEKREQIKYANEQERYNPERETEHRGSQQINPQTQEYRRTAEERESTYQDSARRYSGRVDMSQNNGFAEHEEKRAEETSKYNQPTQYAESQSFQSDKNSTEGFNYRAQRHDEDKAEDGYQSGRSETVQQNRTESTGQQRNAETYNSPEGYQSKTEYGNRYAAQSSEKTEHNTESSQPKTESASMSGRGQSGAEKQTLDYQARRTPESASVIGTGRDINSIHPMQDEKGLKNEEKIASPNSAQEEIAGRNAEAKHRLGQSGDVNVVAVKEVDLSNLKNGDVISKQLHSTAEEFGAENSWTDTGNRQNQNKEGAEKQAQSDIIGNKGNIGNAQGKGETTSGTKQNNKTQQKSTTEHTLYTKRVMYRLGAVPNAKKIKKIERTVTNAVTSTVLSSESEGGKAINETVSATSQYAKIAKNKFLQHEQISLNRHVKIDLDQFAVMYSIKKGVSLEEAKETAVNFAQHAVKMNAGGDVSLQGMSDYIKEVNGSDGMGFIKIFNGLSDEQWANALEKLLKQGAISQELANKLGEIPKGQLSPFKINKLLKECTSDKDQNFLKALMRAVKAGVTPGSLIKAFGHSGMQLGNRIIGQADAVRSLSDITRSAQYAYGAYRSGMKLTMSILNKIPILQQNTFVSTKLMPKLKTLSDPGHAIYGAAKNAALKTNFGQTTAGRLAEMRKKRQTKKLNRKGKNVLLDSIKTAREALKASVDTMVNGSKFLTAVSNVFKSASKAAGNILTQITAYAAPVLGWAVVIVLVIIILSEIISENTYSSNADDGGMSAYTFVQDTEILQEVINDLQQKNEEFNSRINQIKGTGKLTGNTIIGVDATQDQIAYDASKIIFRDWDGNILEPTHTNLNNTKAIITMATRFMPYVFMQPSENATEETKLQYEQIKQHFIDYCDFLWASTHRVDIEEYRPGDAKYSDFDDSDMITAEGTGICEQDGKTLWLADDYFFYDYFNYDGELYKCSTCSDMPETGYGEEGYALCSHELTSQTTDGWSKAVGYYSGGVFIEDKNGTEIKRPAVNCREVPKAHGGHYKHESDSDGSSTWYEVCNLVSNGDKCDACSAKHFNYKGPGDSTDSSCHHDEYLWVYHCGGHYGSVVYVTVGDLSRYVSFGEAGDVDYEAVGVYPDEEQLFTWDDDNNNNENEEGEDGKEEDKEDEKDEEGEDKTNNKYDDYENNPGYGE